MVQEAAWSAPICTRSYKDSLERNIRGGTTPASTRKGRSIDRTRTQNRGMAHGKCQRWTAVATLRHQVDHERQFHPATSFPSYTRTRQYDYRYLVLDRTTELTASRISRDTDKRPYEPASRAQIEIDISQSKTSRTRLELGPPDRRLQRRSARFSMAIGITGVTTPAQPERLHLQTKACLPKKERSRRGNGNGKEAR